MTNSSTPIVARVCATVAAVLAGMSLVVARPFAQTSTTVPVQWTNVVHATASAGDIQKSSGCGGCPDAGGMSAQVVSTSGGFVEFVPVKGRDLFAGLGANTTAATDPALIDYGFGFWADGGWDIRERSVYKTEGRFVNGDSFRVAVNAGLVTYYKNGKLVYSSIVPASKSMVLRTTLVDASAHVKKAVIASVATPPVVVPVTIGTTSLPGGTLSQPYSTVLTASGGHGTFLWSETGAMPAGLTLAPSGTISGTPTTSGQFTFTVRAVDAIDAANSATQSLGINVSTGTVPPVVPVTISTTSLPAGTLSQRYSTVLTASGGHGTFLWSETGALPAGLTLASSGTISGTPTASGQFTFTVRAVDAIDPANSASRSLGINVPASPPPVTGSGVAIVTAALPSTRVDDFYSVPVVATGGGGVYRWSVVSGALPPGLSLDAATGTIQGTASSGGRFQVTVRAADAVNLTNLADRTLAMTVFAASPPSVYSAISDRVTRAKGPVPALGAAGYAFRDPAFGSRLVRITDGLLQPDSPNISYRTPSGTHTNAWSADGQYFYAVNSDGWPVPFSFDRTTMRARRLMPTTTGDGGMMLQFFNEPTFSYLTPGVLYGTFNGNGSTLHSVDQYDFDTGQYTQLMNLESLAPNLANTYTGGVGASAGAVERIMAFFGGTSQDYHFYLLVFDKENPSRRHLINTIASTIDGKPTNIPLNFHIHAAAIDRSGEFIMVYPTGDDLSAPRHAAPAYVWDLVTNRLTELPLIEAITGGHDAYGFGYRVNQDCCTNSTWDASQWQFRSLANPLVTLDLNPNVLLPQEVYLEDHPSWHNAQADRLVPFIDANYRYGDNTTPWRAWDEEVFAVQTEGAGTGGTIWRFAHHRSATADDNDPMQISFWYTPRANVSPDGRWALFTSNWDKTLGIDPRNDVGGKHREDVFLVELK
jgi:hypothetical protein